MSDYQSLRQVLNTAILREKADGIVPDEEIKSVSCDLKNILERCREFNEQFRLYRYSRADYTNIRNFEKSRLYLSAIGKMNDVFDGLITDWNEESLTEYDLQQLEDIAFIKCFSEDKDNLLMWAHYAQNHEGICVAYDLALLEDSHSSIDYIFPVFYSKDRSIIHDKNELVVAYRELNEFIYNEEIDSCSNPEENPCYNSVLALFLAKSKEWEYEKEWRLVIPKVRMHASHIFPSLEDLYSDHIVEFDCVAEIYLGYRIESDIRENIIEIVKRKNFERISEQRRVINVYQCKLHKSEYKLMFSQIL